MRKKAAYLVTVLMAVVLVGILTVADLITEERVFSQSENRVLASRPQFSLKELFGGDYTSDYETYVTDQFVARDTWIGVKTYADVALGRKEVGGVYLAKDGSLIEQHKSSGVKEEDVQKKLELLRKLTDYYEQSDKVDQIKVLLAPTGDNVLTHNLPAYADYYDQKPFLKQVEDAVGKDQFVDALSVMLEHKGEEIYYKTDHHWTTLGAYYAYEEWAKSMGLEPVSFAEDKREIVTEDFLGTLHSKINISVKPEKILVYKPSLEEKYSVFFDLLPAEKNSIYEPKHLDTKNKYGYFLDDNHGFIEINTDVKNGRTLMVIKDSFANCFLPFAMEHYEKICVIDLRYCNTRLFPLIDEWVEAGNADMLILYNVIHFLDDFKFL